MHQLRRSFLVQGLMACDTLAVAGSLALGLSVSAAEAREAAFREFPAVSVSLIDGLIVLAFLVACRHLFAHYGLYRSQRLGRGRDLYRRMPRAVGAATLLLWLLRAVFGIGALDWRFFAVFGASALAALTGSRAALYRFLEIWRRNGRNLRNIVIAGAGPRGLRFAAELENHPELGYRVLGFVDDARGARGAGAPFLGSLGDLNQLLRTGEVDEVAIALPLKTLYAEASRIVSLCEQHGVITRVPGDVFQASVARMESEQFEGLSVLTLFTVPGSSLSFLVKRMIDVAGAAGALALCLPLLALIALAVKIDSPGPVLFRQIRVGYNGRRFRMLKFRTMTADAEARQRELEHLNEADGAAFKIRNDPRLTRAGRWLRRASLDELPQLVNVLKGEMSLVGPRPLPVRDVERMSADWQRRRFSVRPGLTGLWQANGRHRIGFEDWMRLDLHYIDNWSLLLDLRILLRTLPAVVSGAGAS